MKRLFIAAAMIIAVALAAPVVGAEHRQPCDGKPFHQTNPQCGPH